MVLLGFFRFGNRKRGELEQKRAHARRELTAELEALRTELELLSEKLNIELKSDDGDRTTTLSRYPRRIVELKIQIDELERKLSALDRKR